MRETIQTMTFKNQKKKKIVHKVINQQCSKGDKKDFVRLTVRKNRFWLTSFMKN